MSVCAYMALVVLLRISGKRTLTKMNAFDFVITVAFGSTLATIILSKQTALIEGITALGMLVLLQFCITWLSVRFKTFSDLVKNQPRLLYYHGEFLEKNMKDERVTKAEMLAVLRENSMADITDAEAIVLETSGKLAVIKKGDSANNTTLSGIPKQ